MSTLSSNPNASVSVSKAAITGAIAGLVGGLVFGIMMAMQGILPMVGMLIRQESAVIGFIVHMLISAFIGAVYGVAISRFDLSPRTAVLGGVVNGIVWWMLGALILMPLGLGMTDMVFAIGQMQWMSLLGHLIYGLITAFVYRYLALRG
ncbi:MAG: hypothetical protein R6X18_02430 [Chloroflexota bacterium]|jgi:uncharacterized membrane protein YagU involved in acid resistance